MKKLFISIIMMLALCPVGMNAQSVQRQGNTFTQVPNKKNMSDSTKTAYTYRDAKGKVYPIFLSSRGKAYIRTSEKEGAKGRRYMPEIGKQINPSAYKEK